MIEIKNRYSNAVIKTVDADTLHGADLHGANLCGANLCGADLHGAKLCVADLCWANLRGADLHGANLCGASLCGTDLRGASLHGANLCGADLHGADLRKADLRKADLYGADLREANLHEAQISNRTLLPAPTMMLLASWGEVSDDLTRDLMIFDGWCHPDPARFAQWADDGPCPYADVHVQRAVSFTERKELWPKSGPVTPQSPYELMMRLIKECCDWSDE